MLTARVFRRSSHRLNGVRKPKTRTASRPRGSACYKQATGNGQQLPPTGNIARPSPKLKWRRLLHPPGRDHDLLKTPGDPRGNLLRTALMLRCCRGVVAFWAAQTAVGPLNPHRIIAAAGTSSLGYYKEPIRGPGMVTLEPT
jgi:hypothetical protein